jgi:putative SOS response-associated peptidase YedK
MCSHYQALKDRERYRREFHVDPPDDLGKFDVWPGYAASFIRVPKEADSGDEAVPAREAVSGQFGLIPHWATDLTISRRTFNCRSETASSKPSFRDAWKHGQRCIIPADAIYEPDWRTGKAIPTRISRADGEPMGIAGLWSWWKSPKGDLFHSFSMLTINAAEHALMNQFHKTADEKRMVVILPEGSYADWLSVPVNQAMDFMRAYPAEALEAVATPR